MTQFSSTPSSGVARERKQHLRRVLFSSYLGSTIEFYDFLLYGLSASLVFGPLFFTNLSPLVATTASFGTLAAGYLARPLGGVLFGHFGDRLGRKSMLVITMTMMGLSSCLVGLLPTYDQIGTVAPILLVVLRLIQGLAVGGEWGGAALMAIEHAHSRHRGFAGSVANMGGPSGAVLATIILTLFTLLPHDQFMTWGWRVPFLLSAVLVAVGLFIRLRITETPLFEAAKRDNVNTDPRPPLLRVLREQPAEVLIAWGAGLGAFTVQSLMMFALSYAMHAGHNRTTVLTLHGVGAFLTIFAIPAFAALSDRVGRRPVMLAGCLATVVLIYPVYLLLAQPSLWALLAAFLISQPLLLAAMYGPLAAFISEMFDTGSRYTGASLGYQLSVMAAGFAPMISSALLIVRGGHDPSMVALFTAVVCLASATAIWLAPESSRRRLDRVHEKSTPQPATPAGNVAEPAK